MKDKAGADSCARLVKFTAMPVMESFGARHSWAIQKSSFVLNYM